MVETNVVEGLVERVTCTEIVEAMQRIKSKKAAGLSTALQVAKLGLK